jgi:hypothetical protein
VLKIRLRNAYENSGHWDLQSTLCAFSRQNNELVSIVIGVDFSDWPLNKSWIIVGKSDPDPR